MKQESQQYNTKSFMIKLKRNKLKHELKKYNLIILIGLEEKEEGGERRSFLVLN